MIKIIKISSYLQKYTNSIISDIILIYKFINDFLRKVPGWVMVWLYMGLIFLIIGYIKGINGNIITDISKEIGYILLGGVVIYIIFEKQKDDIEKQRDYIDNNNAKILLKSYINELKHNIHINQFDQESVENLFKVEFGKYDGYDIWSKILNDINWNVIQVSDIHKLDLLRKLIESSKGMLGNYVNLIQKISYLQPNILNQKILKHSELRITFNQLLLITINTLEIMESYKNSKYDHMFMYIIESKLNNQNSSNTIALVVLNEKFHERFKNNTMDLKMTLFFIQYQTRFLESLKNYLDQ